jgi:tryptophanyl-tRNA synthetase
LLLLPPLGALLLSLRRNRPVRARSPRPWESEPCWPGRTKSLGNAILLSDPGDVVRQRVMSMYTDPNRLRATDPGTVEGNPVFIYHDAFNPDRDEVADLKARYREGRVGDVEVKKKLFAALDAFIAPIRERRAAFAERPGLIEEILHAGNERMGMVARDTLARVREAMGMTYFRR